MKRLLIGAVSALSLAALSLSAASRRTGQHSGYGHPYCAQNANPPAPTQPVPPLAYTGHDEPSLLFYSNTAGSGNNATYSMTLPTDPRRFPRQDSSGGTFNFQLHPAFWFGMAICDNQSARTRGEARSARPCRARQTAIQHL